MIITSDLKPVPADNIIDTMNFTRLFRSSVTIIHVDCELNKQKITFSHSNSQLPLARANSLDSINIHTLF